MLILEVRHEPIPSMRWGEMQLGFAVADNKRLPDGRPGSQR